MWKKKMPVFLALLLVLSLSGCETLFPMPESQSSNAPVMEQPPEKKPVKDTPLDFLGLAYYTEEPVSPVSSRSRINQLLLEALYEGLFMLDDNFKPVPVLCGSWQGADLVWSFTLKNDLTFWSGEPVTAEDVAASWQAAIDDEDSPYHARFADVENISAAGSQLTVTLISPNADLPSLLDVPICRAGTENDTFADGTGPYRPVQENGVWSLVCNENWHGGKVTAFQNIHLTATSRAETLSNSFETGDISLSRTERISPRSSASVGATNVYRTRTTDFHYLGMNQDYGAFSLPVVRQAISLLIQRTSLCSAQLQNYADPAYLPVNPQPAAESSGASPDPLEMLTNAGFADNNEDGILDYIPPPTRWYTPYWHEKFAPVILVNSDNAYKVAAAEAIAQTLQAAGIGASVNALPYDDFIWALQRGNFDLYYGETALTPDFDIRPLVAKDGALNYGKFDDEEFEAALNASRTMEDKTSFYQQFSETLPIIPLAFERNQVVTRAGLLENFNPYPHQIFAGVENWEAR